MKPGDIIVGFNNQPVEDASQLGVLVSTVNSGVTVPVEVVRDGEHLTLTTIIGDRDEFLASRRGSEDQDDFQIVEWMGMELMNLTPDIAHALSIDHVDGLYVRRVYAGTPADRASITQGSIILQIAKKTTKSLKDADNVIRKLPGGSNRIALIVQEPDGTIARKVMRK
jgi:serine protease Do